MGDREGTKRAMNEQEAREATRLRDAAYAALMRGAMKTAREAIEAFMSFDREEALGMLTSLGIETNDAEKAEKALKELKELAPEKPYTRYLSARVAYMKGARASLIEPLESLLEDKNASAQIRERACNLLGRSCRQLGEPEKAAKYDLEASRIAPQLGAGEYSNYLYDLHYLPGLSPEEQRAAAARYDDFFKDVERFRHRRRQGERPLRIGYISSDFRYHVVLRFVAAMLWGHGRTPFKVYAYMTGEEDAFSLELTKRVDYWRNLRGLSPEAAARRIYEDEIDILVELGGHTVGNSLPVMAYKPAPIQISGIGYWASTGLSAIDYFLGDAYLDDEETQKAFTEALLVLPRTHFCYTEVGNIPLPAEEPPCRRNNGAVTFGSFNDFGKTSDETLRLWAEILARVPGSRLLLKGKIFDEPDNRAYALARMERMGIPQERVEARGFSFDYLGEYADMDIALDTFPYPGGGTTCDALFMGVPVVTMAGADHGGRFGKSLLMNLGLGELVADTPEAYVEKAVGVAGDEELLLVLRKNLRDMMQRSPLMDAEQYRQELTAVYTQVWKQFVDNQPTPKPGELSGLAERMEAFRRAGDKKQALAEADAIWAARPEDEGLLTRVAEIAVQAGDAALARDVSVRLREISGNHGYALYLAAAAAWLSEDAAGEPWIDEALSDASLTEAQRGEALFLRGEIKRAKGDAEEAAKAYLAASSARASSEAKAEAYSRYLLCLYLAGKGAEFIGREAKRYGTFFADISPYSHDPAEEHHDTLHIGYILHGTKEKDNLALIDVLFRFADRYRFELYGYTLEDMTYGDPLFSKLAKCRCLSGLSAREAAACVHEDGIDILVDLTGHTPGNGLPILAYKPAPIQVSGIGYPATTGLPAVDYFLTDVYASRKGEERFFSEKLIRLPESHFCCRSPQGAEVYILPAPMLETGYWTFGVLARWEKATDEAIRAWAEILRRVGGARLLVQDGIFDDEARRAEALTRMEAAGLDTSRVELVGWTESYLMDYRRVDIALDTFPQTGKRSACEALYLGIPVVARKGRGHTGRLAESVLANAGLNSLCASDWTAYVRAAVDLAEDRERYIDLHMTLRRKVKQTALMNAQRYMDALEEAYGEIFAAWESQTDMETHKENLMRRWNRFQKARAESRWGDGAAMGSRLVFAGVNMPETIVDVSDVYYKLKDKWHCLYWMSRAEKLKPKGRTRLLAWLAVAQEEQDLLLTAKKTRQQMLYSISNKKDARHLCYLVWMQYGSLTFRLGMAEEARHAYEEAHRFGDTLSERVVSYGSILLSYNNEEISPKDLFEKSRKYADLFQGIKKYSHSRQRPEHKRLRVGYVSPDFREHVMFHFILPFLTFRDKERFEVYAYSSADKKDISSDILKKMVDVWRDVDPREPEATAKTIYEDEIDILFDLAGHTGNSAVAAFAYKPAPIQISGLGYMATTGLDTMDYFLTDPFVDPPGEHEAYFTEKPLYVSSQFCYVATGAKEHPPSTGAPSKKCGWVTFGVFNQYAKAKDDMLLAWKEILRRVPKSRLLWKCGAFSSVEVEDEAYRRMKDLGFPMERVTFEIGTKAYMERYLDVDIALDTYPWPGGGTTCDTLYMGVPLVTRYSDRRSTRFSYGLLQNVGLGDLTAATVEEYIEKAVALASDEELLDALHKNLRRMMEQSPMMDATRYIREVEARYEEIWKKWRTGES